MKRIKRIFSILLVLVCILVLSGCKKDYSSITYKQFVDIMSNDLNYYVSDKTLDSQDVYQRYYLAIKDGVLISYYEFEDEDAAKDYLERNYKDKKYYSYKEHDDYSTVKYSKVGYAYFIQVDNIIISGSTENESEVSEVKKVIKELGYQR